MCLGIPGRIASIERRELLMGSVVFGGIQKLVCLEYVPDAVVGEYVIVHAGFAISRLNEAEAARVLATLAELGDLSVLGEVREHGAAPALRPAPADRAALEAREGGAPPEREPAT